MTPTDSEIPPDADSQLEVACQVCGKPVIVHYKATGIRHLDETMLKVAKTIVHNHCYNERVRQKKEADETERLNQRTANWRLLCEPFYQTSHEWILTAGAAKKVNMAAVKKALEWQYGPKGMILSGRKSGTGKTTTAWAVLHREFNLGRFIVAISHTELSQKATQIATSSDLLANRWMHTIKNCDLLFIDDLGKSRFKSVSGDGRASEEFLFDLVDGRIKSNLPTIITCNMNGEDLQKSMSEERGEAFVRRLREFFVNVKYDAGEK